MKIRINGKIYLWVDTQYDDDFIYDIYEDEYGNQIRRIVGTR